MANGVPQAPRYFNEQLASGVVAERVLDMFEPAEGDEQHRDRRPCPGRSLQYFFALRAQPQTIRKGRQGVVAGEERSTRVHSVMAASVANAARTRVAAET